MSGLRVSGLRAAHGSSPVLHGVDLHVTEHALACVVGPSGCGKTTLLRAIAGFHRPVGGRIELTGRVLDAPPKIHLPAEQRRVGYIPQDIALFPHLNVAANIGFGLPRAKRAAKVAELLELVDLGAYADRHPHQLSGGQQQRIALARALAPGPDLLLLDEPFSALDAGLRARVRDEVASLLRRTGTTAILVTHDAQEALAFADVVSIMDGGHVTQTGTPEELYSQPVNARVAKSLGEANLLPAKLAGAADETGQSMAHTALGLLRTSVLVPAAETETAGLAATVTTTVLIRPRQLTVKTHGPGTQGRVTRSEFRGDDHQLEVAIAGLDGPLRAQSTSHIAPGTTVWVTVSGSAHPLLD